MIKKIIAAFLLAFPMLVKAQVNINVQAPPAGLVSKEQLWDLVVVNNNPDMLDITMQLDLQDALTGQVVLTASTGNLLISKGVKMVKAADLQPISYTYNLPDFSRAYLPMGTYIACYQLMNTAGGKESPVARECLRISIDPLSPPMLSSPSDKSTLQSPYPQFTWMPPTPVDMFSSLSYDLLVTEVLEGQSEIEAIQYNTPVYTKSNLTQPYESYSSSFTKLDTGKIYAWQVVAKNGLNYAAKTEVWTFKINKEKNATEVINDTYLLLDNNVTGTYFIQKDFLRIKYFSFSATYTSELIFTDEKTNVIKRIKQTVVPGDNYLDLNISTGFQKNKIYKVSITDGENKQHSLTFSINKN